MVVATTFSNSANHIINVEFPFKWFRFLGKDMQRIDLLTKECRFLNRNFMTTNKNRLFDDTNKRFLFVNMAGGLLFHKLRFLCTDSKYVCSLWQSRYI